MQSGDEQAQMCEAHNKLTASFNTHCEYLYITHVHIQKYKIWLLRNKQKDVLYED